MKPILNIITQTPNKGGFSHLELAKMALSGGATYLQYRNKQFDATPGSADRKELRQICALPRQPHQKIIVNDDPDLAIWAGADGVHLGKGDGNPHHAAHILPPASLIGVTIHSLEELALVNSGRIAYIGVGPVFGTSSKPMDLPPLGLDGLAAICKASPYPVVAIGNIRLINAAEVMAAGAIGVAVISEFCNADHPEKIARKFLEIFG